MKIRVEPSKEEWVARFLNLPSSQQIDFLYQTYLEESARITLEKSNCNK